MRTIIIACLSILSLGSAYGQSYQQQLNKVNRFLETFDNGYYGPLSVRNGHIYCRIKDGRESKIPIAEIDKAITISDDHGVKYICKGGGSCVTGVAGGMFPQLSFRTSVSFDEAQLAQDLNDLLQAIRYAPSESEVASQQPAQRENTPPSISITEPDINRGFKSVPHKLIRVSGRAQDDDGVFEVKINDLDAEMSSGGYFTIQLPLAVGENTVKVIATDTKMKSSFVTFEISRDESSPSTPIASTSPHQETIISQEKRVALIFGNADYTGNASLGDNPINDAQDMASTLRSLGFKVILKTNATLTMMNEAIREFGRDNKDAAVALFYFAGHGMQIERVNYLVPVEVNIANKDDVPFECVNVSTIQRIMESSNENRLNLIVLDACRNNPFRSWERGGDGGLADMTPPSGTLIAFATSPGATASNGSARNGLYTGELIKQLKKPQRIEDVFINTRVEVERQSGGRQSPWELARLRGKFFLSK